MKGRGGIEEREKGIERKRSYRVIEQRVRRKKGIERQRGGIEQRVRREAGAKGAVP